jgi:hypothetical protein
MVTKYEGFGFIEGYLDAVFDSVGAELKEAILIALCANYKISDTGALKLLEDWRKETLRRG